METNPRLLVVDDERPIRRFLNASLSNQYTVLEAANGTDALAAAVSARPDAILLDIGLPDLDGIQLTQRIREWSQVPIIVLSVRDQESDKIAALDAGADDYLTKPFGSGELLARLRVLLRRAQVPEEAGAVKFGEVEVDLTRRVVTKRGAEVRLTAKEYALLRLLLINRDKVITHRLILREIWGPKAEDETHYLRVYMARLRQKLENEPNQPRHFRTEAGIGYRFTGE